jgi:hypothetical protein
MASKLVTERGFRGASVLVFGDQPAPPCARRAAPVRLVYVHLVDVPWIVDYPPPKSSAGAVLGDPK